MKISGGVPGRGRASYVKTLSWLQQDHAGLREQFGEGEVRKSGATSFLGSYKHAKEF